MDASAQMGYMSGQVQAAPRKPETVDWAKFAMWLRGFLCAIEGQPLSPDSVGKIMEKLATVDPDARMSYKNDDNFLQQMAEMQRLMGPRPAMPQLYPSPSPKWVVEQSTTTGKTPDAKWITDNANFNSKISSKHTPVT